MACSRVYTPAAHGLLARTRTCAGSNHDMSWLWGLIKRPGWLAQPGQVVYIKQVDTQQQEAIQFTNISPNCAFNGAIGPATIHEQLAVVVDGLAASIRPGFWGMAGGVHSEPHTPCCICCQPQYVQLPATYSSVTRGKATEGYQCITLCYDVNAAVVCALLLLLLLWRSAALLLLLALDSLQDLTGNITKQFQQIGMQAMRKVKAMGKLFQPPSVSSPCVDAVN